MEPPGYGEHARKLYLRGVYRPGKLTHDNAVAERFFQLLKRERIRRWIYATRDEAKADVFHYIEMFYDTRRQHGHNDCLPPVEFEKRQST